MYASYQIKDFDIKNEDFFELGNAISDRNSSYARKSLECILTHSGSIDAAKMMEEWFPQDSFHVFISHSHSDKNLALAISGWLNSRFGISSFIDSCIWKHADDLLQDLDDEFCPIRPNLYSYEKCRITSAHVHLMLATALTQMMDRCECTFFLNTPRSISSVEIGEMVGPSENETTHSPWLFHEISNLRLLRRRGRDEHRSLQVDFSEGTRKSASVPLFRYPVDLARVPILRQPELSRWRDLASDASTMPRHPLDVLYESILPPA